jgi:septal ring factor EnvC (AmiA/AmiB activator)
VRKAILQLCIYFSVLGFVVHAQTPDGSATNVPKDAYQQMYSVLDKLKLAEEKQKSLEADMARIVHDRDDADSKIPYFWQNSPLSKDQIAAARFEKQKLTRQEVATQNELDEVRKEVLTNGLTLDDINAKTAHLPEDQLREILESRRSPSSAGPSTK